MSSCNPPLTRKEFCDSIKFITTRQSSVDRINELFTEEFEDSVFYPYFKYEAELVRILKKVMKDDSEDSYIDYFLYELDGGMKWTPESITYADGTPIKLQTPEDLYDLLVKEYFTE